MTDLVDSLGSDLVTEDDLKDRFSSGKQDRYTDTTYGK